MADLTAPPQQGGVAVAGGVAEHRVEDGHAVGSDDADSTELLDNAEEDNDEERFVDFRVILNVSHVVTFPLFISPAQSSSQDQIKKNDLAVSTAGSFAFILKFPSLRLSCILKH